MELATSLLIVIDPTTETQPALAQATVLAKKMNLELELLICSYDSNLIEHKNLLDPNDVNRQIDNHLKQHKNTLEKLAKPLREQGFSVKCTTSWDYPLYEGIVRQAMRSKPFLILKDTHPHNKFSRAIFSSTDWNLIMRCPTPVLFIKPDNLWMTPTITCSVNPANEPEESSDIDENILQLGKLLHHEIGGKLNIYHTYLSIMELPQTIYPWGGQFNTIFTEQTDQQIRQSHKQALYKLADQANLDHNYISFEDGDPRYSLPKFVTKSNTDVLIMGSGCKTRFEQVFIGGTTESVLDDIDCDILVVHPEKFKTTVKKDSPPSIK